jgi:hypothetical protein
VTHHRGRQHQLDRLAVDRAEGGSLSTIEKEGRWREARGGGTIEKEGRWREARGGGTMTARSTAQHEDEYPIYQNRHGRALTPREQHTKLAS